MDRKKPRTGWGIILRHLLNYKKDIYFLSVIGVIAAIANGSIPYITGRFFDALLSQEYAFAHTSFKMPLWLAALTIWGVAQITSSTFDWIGDKRRARIGTNLTANYQANALGVLLRLPVAFHKERKSGEIWDRIGKASSALTVIIEYVIIDLAPQILALIVGLMIAFFINPFLAGILLAGMALYIGALIKIVPPIAKLQRRGHAAWNTAYGDAYDALANINTVKQAGAEEYEYKRIYGKFVTIAANLWYRVEKIWTAIHFSQKLIIAGTQLSIFLFSVYLIRGGAITIGNLIALNGYALMVFRPFSQIGYNWQSVQNGAIAMERADKLLASPQERYTPRRVVHMETLRGAIEFRDVSFSYKKNEPRVLSDINFTADAGETVAFVGESGVGKSTIVDLLSGYYLPTGGQILIDGVDMRNMDLQFLRQHIAVVPQEAVLFNDTIKRNIRYGSFDVADNAVKWAAQEAHANVFIEKFPKKYDQIVGERGIKLSVGQKQRIAIARAILRDPRILILDEPTSALDIQTERYIAGSLEKLMKGRTTFIIAHRLSTVRNADKILVIENGKVAEKGTHEDLVKKRGIYHRLYNLHIGLA